MPFLFHPQAFPLPIHNIKFDFTPFLPASSTLLLIILIENQIIYTPNPSANSTF